MNKQQRNDKCSCGRGKKYKKCHLLIEREEKIKQEIEFNRQMIERAKARQIDQPPYRKQTRRSSVAMMAMIAGAMWYPSSQR